MYNCQLFELKFAVSLSVWAMWCISSCRSNASRSRAAVQARGLTTLHLLLKTGTMTSRGSNRRKTIINMVLVTSTDEDPLKPKSWSMKGSLSIVSEVSS
ncbi:hypothetical protein MAR_011568, partial [Mya arenaria]